MASNRYIILPSNGFRSDVMAVGRLQTQGQFEVSRPGSDTPATVRVLDQISHDGPKLVEMSSDGEIALMKEYAGEIRVIPLHFYSRPKPSVRESAVSDTVAEGGQSSSPWQVAVSARDSKEPLANVTVVAFTDFRQREGVKAQTGPDGIASIVLPEGEKVERLYCFPSRDFWGSLSHAIVVGGKFSVSLTPIDLKNPDLVLTRFRGDLPTQAGALVRVGIIDTGIAQDHPNLNVSGGRNCVFEEVTADPNTADDWQDVDRHGTHVAGIVAGRATQDSPFQGVAPAVELRAYRVFGRDGSDATTFDVMKAVDFARADGCHVINLSLGGGSVDEALRGALGDARGAGVFAVAAVGNETRRPVLYPAAYETVSGISALGLRGSFPAGTPEEADIGSPTSPIDKNIFLARFTNVGPQVNFIAPGVGVVSTVPGGGFLAMSGTSMAAPMVAGLASALLSTDPFLLTMEPYDRLKELTKMMYEACRSLRLPRDFEGAGLPLPPSDWRQALSRNDT